MTTFGSPDEAPDVRKAREELHRAELALRDQRERVAELRRSLPRTPSRDYVLREGPRALAGPDTPVRDVRLSELFDDPAKPLVLMHFMYGKKQAEPCPMCTLWADGYDGQVPHLEQRVNFAVLVAGDVAPFREYARGRGWRNLRIVSAGDSSLKRDHGFEGEDGSQEPGVSVFTRAGDGGLEHFYSGSANMGNGEFRGMDLLTGFWSFLDLTPQGRGDFFPRKDYGLRA